MIRKPKPNPSVKPGWISTSLDLSGWKLFIFPALSAPIWLVDIIWTVLALRICSLPPPWPRLKIICMKHM